MQSESFEQQVVTRLSNLENFQQQVVSRLDRLDADVSGLKTDLSTLSIRVLEANTRIEAYQKASNQVVNLAFALITAATVSIILQGVLK